MSGEEELYKQFLHRQELELRICRDYFPDKVTVMDFEILEKDIEQLNMINVNANYTSRDRYHALYNSIYERLLDMEKDGEIVPEPGKKGLGYLRELLMNDGPEFSYTIVFRSKDDDTKKYKIGVCIRGLPICKRVTE